MTRCHAVALNLFKTKSPDLLMAEAAAPDRQFKRALGAFDLTALASGPSLVPEFSRWRERLRPVNNSRRPYRKHRF